MREFSFSILLVINPKNILEITIDNRLILEAKVLSIVVIAPTYPNPIVSVHSIIFTYKWFVMSLKWFFLSWWTSTLWSQVPMQSQSSRFLYLIMKFYLASLSSNLKKKLYKKEERQALQLSYNSIELLPMILQKNSFLRLLATIYKRLT